MTSLPIFNIERFAIHDGTGIRTAVFLQGCQLHCQWCANPESQQVGLKLMFLKDKCTGCGRCVPVCPQHAISLQDGKAVVDRTACTACGRCVKACLNDARSISGRWMDLQEIHDTILRDRDYYEETDGGVTFSGGEPVLQAAGLEPLLKQLCTEKIGIAFETCGHAPLENYRRLAPYVSEWLFDVKSLQKEVLKQYTGADLDVILTNLRYLSSYDPARVHIRVPVIPGVNNTMDDVERLAELMKECSLQKVDLLPYHTLGLTKYRQLGIPYPFGNEHAMHPEDVEPLKEYLESCGLTVSIGG
ncbi:MAG: glycyl-radical enzyme activating protein [Catenisphaera adipataccumulans]|jgi:pyruvate formate lyase activating enzyme|uniref:glycyl-radical enzyme activating protein n=1 Tax=Catenisphaera adipataccumulans TaxID=700500 RepID=UPI003D8CFDE6